MVWCKRFSTKIKFNFCSWLHLWGIPGGGSKSRRAESLTGKNLRCCIWDESLKSRGKFEREGGKLIFFIGEALIFLGVKICFKNMQVLHQILRTWGHKHEPEIRTNFSLIICSLPFSYLFGINLCFWFIFPSILLHLRCGTFPFYNIQLGLSVCVWCVWWGGLGRFNHYQEMFFLVDIRFYIFKFFVDAIGIRFGHMVITLR